MKKKTTFLTVVILLVTTMTFGQKKQDLKVLYVGYDPGIPLDISQGVNIGSMTPERFKEDLKTRYPEFVSYLNQYFTNVEAVDARNYKREMSAKADVTIFDQTIEPWKERIVERVDGKVHYEPAKYLTEDFDHATIFIGHTAPEMGESVGSKLDWLCLCLDADAHHLETGHPIFKGPFPVELTFNKKNTPKNIYMYPSGKTVPKEIPMWRVQKEGYMEGKGYRVGMVSRGNGFLDSPDTEYISSGVNTKDVGAVAIGRHGNFFMWGFSASPDYMTDEAKQVFANAVVYMKQFKGQKPLVRKYKPTIATKDFVDYIIGSLDQEMYQRAVEYIKNQNTESEKRIKELKERQANGEQLSEQLAAFVERDFEPMPVPTWEEYAQQQAGAFYKPEYAGNYKALQTYLKENRAYMYSKPDEHSTIQVDEDLKTLGVGNDTLAFFETVIPLLDNVEKSETAKLLLERYTGMEKTRKEWEQWFGENRDKLFFTEAGGYKWLINTIK